MGRWTWSSTKSEVSDDCASTCELRPRHGVHPSLDEQETLSGENFTGLASRDVFGQNMQAALQGVGGNESALFWGSTGSFHIITEQSEALKPVFTLPGSNV